MGVGEKGQEMRGLGRPPSHGRGCLEATARGPDAQMLPQLLPGPDTRCLGLWGARSGEWGVRGGAPGGTEHRHSIDCI